MHRRVRLEFAERHLEWTMDDWKRVWWSDETKINRLGSDGRDQVWVDKENRQDHRRMKQTVKFGEGNLSATDLALASMKPTARYSFRVRKRTQ